VHYSNCPFGNVSRRDKCTNSLPLTSARFILPDYPHTTKFLSAEERSIAIRRVQNAGGVKDEEKAELLDGLKLAAFVSDRWPPVHIIVTTGRAEPPGLPPNALFIPKPYLGSSVVAAMRTFANM